MNTEKIKEKCSEIEKALKEGKTPQEIAEMFGAVKQGANNDYEYEEYIIDFEGFGITFWKEPNDTRWFWENQDEIWLFETDDWAHWKSL